MLTRFVKDLIAYMPSKLLPALIGLITAPILTRLFLPAEFGNWALALGISDFLFALACSGIGSSVIRFFPSYKVKSELGVFFTSLLTTTGSAIGVVSAISILALIFVRSQVPKDLYPLLFISILLFMVESIFTIFSEVLRAQNRSVFYSWLYLGVNYGGLGLGLVLATVFGLRIKGLMLGALIITFVTLPFLLRATLRGVYLGLKSFRKIDILALWRYAWPLALGNMAFWGLRLSDRFVIGFFRSTDEVGIYSAVYNLSDKSITVLVALFLLSMGPMINTVWEEQGREATEKIVTMITRLFLILCLPAAIGLSVLALPFTTVLMGTAYHEGFRIVGFVTFSSLTYGLSQIASRGTLIAKDTRKVGINFILAALINLGLNLVLIPRFGYIVAGITTLVGYGILFVLQILSSRPYLTWRFPYMTLRNVIGASMVMGFSIWGIYALSGPESIGSPIYLLLSILVAVFTYFLSLWLLGEANGGEKHAIKQVINKFTGGRMQPQDEGRES